MKPSIKIEWVPTGDLRPHPNNARKHSKKQINQIANSITHFGWINPIVVDASNTILVGHGRWLAAQKLGLALVPVIRVWNMTEADKRAFMLADNRLAENATWDKEILAIELEELSLLDFNIELTGFEIAQVDAIITDAAASDPSASQGPEDAQASIPITPVSRLGDIWECGRHRVLCGDARNTAALAALLGPDRVDLVFTDPPYNVPNTGHVRAKGVHREFAMAHGEMNESEFETFLVDGLEPAFNACMDGAVIFVCMDWRHARELLGAARCLGLTQLNLCVWTKTNGGMGSLYRSQHELVFVFKKGDAPHGNNVRLGATGRNRTNVWRYAGVNSFKAEREEELALHPTVKPVALVEDAIKDITKRNALVLDPFAGSGTTLIAAERCGRRARLIEFDPAYCDAIVQRFERYTGKQATLAGAAETFEDVAARRNRPRAAE